MSIITSLAGVSRKESKRAMKDLLLFEGKLALVSENKDLLSTVYSRAHVVEGTRAEPHTLENLETHLSQNFRYGCHVTIRTYILQALCTLKTQYCLLSNARCDISWWPFVCC